MNIVDQSLDPISSKDENLEPGELLEEGWFFGNLLDRKKRMSRSYSDPCTSSNSSPEILSEKSYEETYAAIKKLSSGKKIDRSNLMRTPSLPEEGSDHRKKKSNRKVKHKELVRAPSMPSYWGEEEFQDEESDFSMGKLIRQASLNHSDRGPPIRPAPKVVTHRYNIPKISPQRKPDKESINREDRSEMKPKYPIDQTVKLRKSFSDIEIEKTPNFQDLSSEKKNANVIINSLEEKKASEDQREKHVRRTPYLSEAWRAQNSAPPIPKWVGKRSNEDIKAQIRFWARAVASNVRQEC